jgi:hypothetical protein
MTPGALFLLDSVAVAGLIVLGVLVLLGGAP